MISCPVDLVRGNCNVPHPSLGPCFGSHGHGVELSGRRIVSDQAVVLQRGERQLLNSAACRRGGSYKYSCDRNRLRQGSCSRLPDAWLPRPGRHQVIKSPRLWLFLSKRRRLLTPMKPSSILSLLLGLFVVVAIDRRRGIRASHSNCSRPPIQPRRTPKSQQFIKKSKTDYERPLGFQVGDGGNPCVHDGLHAFAVQAEMP